MNTEPTKHKHADLILEYARQQATGEIAAGWWKWEAKINALLAWVQINTPSFALTNAEYRYTPTEKNPAFKPKLKLIAMHELPLGTIVYTSYTGEAQLMSVRSGTNAWVWKSSGRTETENISDLRVTENKEFTFYDCKAGKCPAPEGVKVEVLFRDSANCTRSVSNFVWTYLDDKDKEIIAYRIVGVAEGYTDNPDRCK